MTFVALSHVCTLRHYDPLQAPAININVSMLEVIGSLVLLAVSSGTLLAYHMHDSPLNNSDDIRLPTIRSSVVLRRTWLMLAIQLLSISLWSFSLAWQLEALLSQSDTYPWPLALPITAIVTRVYLLILIIQSFTRSHHPLSPSRFTIYNPHFLCFYTFYLATGIMDCSLDLVTMATASSACSFWNMQTIVDFANVGCTLISWQASITAPAELSPRELLDVEDVDESVMVLHDGQVVRSGRILSPEANASAWSCMTFSWMNGLMSANEHLVSPEHLWCLPLHLRSLANDLHFRLFSSTFTHPHPLARLIFTSNRRAIYTQFVSALAAVVFHYGNPYFLLRLLRFLQDPADHASYNGYLYCALIFACSIASTLIASQTLLFGRRWRISLTNMLHTALYRHALTTMSPNHLGNPDTLPLLVRNDVDRLAELASHLHIFYTCPLEIMAGIAFLYYLLGNAFFVGLGAMAVILPLTHLCSRKLAVVQQRSQDTKAWRLHLVQTLIKGMQSLKYLAWERKWQHAVLGARNEEMDQLVNVYWKNAILGLIWFLTPVLVTSISFAWYTVVDQRTLDASTVFVSIVLYGMLRDPLNVMPQAFLTYNDAKVSLANLEQFLAGKQDQPDPTGLYNLHHRPIQELARVGFSQQPLSVDLRTSAPVKKPTLVIPTFDFPVGVSIVTGPPASGKSTLLTTLLQGTPPSSHWVYLGQAHLPSRYCSQGEPATIRDPASGLSVLKVAYVSQTPWLLTDPSATLRSQIVFFDAWNRSRYEHVVRQCDLTLEFARCVHGDSTKTHLASLSNLFVAKLALARALYSDAKTVVLDDPFSSIQGGDRWLMTCTQTDFWGLGRIVILSTSVPLGSWAREAALVVDTAQWLEQGPLVVLKDRDQIHQRCTPTTTQQTCLDLLGPAHADAKETSDAASTEKYNDPIPVPAMTNAWKAYLSLNGGWCFWTCTLLIALLARTATIAESYWLKVWTTGSLDNISILPWQGLDLTRQQYIGIYVGICLVGVGLNFIRTVLHHRGSLRASGSLFSALLQATIQSPLSQDVTPQPLASNGNSETIPWTQLFGKDMDAVDQQLGLHVSFMIQALVAMVGIVLAIGTVFPIFFPIMALAFLAYGYYGLRFVHTSRKLKAMELAAQTSVNELYLNTLRGLLTIRAFGKQHAMMTLMYQTLDDTMRPFYLLWTLNRWLFIRVETIGATMCLSLGICLVWQRGHVDAGLAGFVLTMAASLLEYIYWCMRQTTTLQLQVDSAQQIINVIHRTPPNPEAQDAKLPLADNWPISASVDVHDLTCSQNGSLLLDGISLTVHAGETMVLAGDQNEPLALAHCLYRFLVMQQGSIQLDGIDITWLDAEDLRSRMTFIGKTKTMISDTVRGNLDPFGEYGDYELWQVLQRVKLASPQTSDGIIYDLDLALDEQHLTTTELQRLAMARALLLGSTKLVVLDFATDDPLVGQVLQEQMPKSTILILTDRQGPGHFHHDRMAVFDHGQLVQIKPGLLLETTCSSHA
ncbi:hypothetical protein DM01DRAFT_1315750 [Hesseltinella vesiculosa]|uniref:P-loop containing nucleoside triphosphate hydrolase protein n=1 Tax=Hesseltinella vesiculosa TaxID=101127 RepID=A0A1X2GW86_9FUNG|nr:hypothetical protein DM01DRAFT_1315750 [Hesseltinella vesiculosa]